MLTCKHTKTISLHNRPTNFFFQKNKFHETKINIVLVPLPPTHLATLGWFSGITTTFKQLAYKMFSVSFSCFGLKPKAGKGHSCKIYICGLCKRLTVWGNNPLVEYVFLLNLAQNPVDFCEILSRATKMLFVYSTKMCKAVGLCGNLL